MKVSRTVYINLYNSFMDNHGDYPSVSNDRTTRLSPEEYDFLWRLLYTLDAQTANKILREYLKLLRFKKGDSFEKHFQVEEEPHFWKTESGCILDSCDFGKTIIEKPPYMAGPMLKFTRSEVEASGFDISKVHVCDEEFE